MTQKADLHRLVDELPDQQTEAAARLLEALRLERLDPMDLTLLLAAEGEPVTKGERMAIAQAERDEAEGAVYTTEEARRLLINDP